ncbi:MAG: hypothetical protein ACI8PQ_000191 [Planctomycetota bacterium]|jgi:hypothetical protein
MNYLTKHALDRRTLLRGSCAALALPTLSAMTPALSPVAASPRRLVFVYVPNGVIGDLWEVAGTGALGQLSPTLSPLQAHAEELRVISGLAHRKGRANGDGPGDHARAAGSWLTASQPYKGDGTRLSVGESVDQVAARSLGRETRLPSLSLGAEGGRLSGQCDSGYPCAYSNTISWRTAHTPVPKESDPRRVFDSLVGDIRPGESAEDRRQRLATRRSVLDYVRNDARRLSSSLGSDDQVKLEEYLEAVRAVEIRLQRLELDGPSELGGVERPKEQPKTHALRTEILFELLALALETDTTRVATLMIGNEGSSRSYKMLGVRGSHHEISHHKGEAEKIADLGKINKHHIELFAPFIARLGTRRENEMSILDNSAVVYGSGLSDGNRHDHGNLPVLIAGRLGGTIETGQHAEHPENTPMANLFLSLLDGVGTHLDQFGDSTGRLGLLGM